MLLTELFPTSQRKAETKPQHHRLDVEIWTRRFLSTTALRRHAAAVGMAPRSRCGSSRPRVSHCSKPTSRQPPTTAQQHPSSSESARCRVWVQTPTDQLFQSPVTTRTVRNAPQTQSHPPRFCYRWFAALGEGRLADTTAAQQSQTLPGNRFFSV